MVAGLVLLSTAVVAEEQKAQKEQAFDAQVNLGGAYTSIGDYNGEGYQASALINYPLVIEELSFYGRISVQSTHDENDGVKQYLDENELIFGLMYQVNDDISLFIEDGDLKQSFETGNELKWKTYMNVSRLGAITKMKGFEISANLEQREGEESELGYRTSISYGDFRLSYTDVGDYQSIGFSFQHRF